MFQSTLSVDEFEPGKYLRLEESGLNWRILPRVVATLFLLPFVLGPLFAIAGMIALGGNGSQAEAQFGAQVALVAGGICFFLFWYAIIGFFAYMLGLFLGSWNLIEVSTRSQEITLQFRGTFLWFTSTTTIPIREIQHLDMSTSGGGDRECLMKMEITYEQEYQDTTSVSPMFRVRHVDLVEETIALVCAVGDLVGMRYYRVDRSDHLETTVQLFKKRTGASGEDQGELREIPEISSGLNFQDDVHVQSGDSDGDVVTFHRPEIDLPPFDPDEFKERKPFLSPEFEWDPGNKVVIDVPPMSFWAEVLVSVFIGSVIGGGMYWMFGPFFEGWLNELEINVNQTTAGLVLGVALTVVSWGVIQWKNYRRRTELNWTSDHIELQIGNRRVSESIKSAKGLVVNGQRHRGDDDSPTKYQCSVLIDLPDGRERIIQTWRSTDEDEVYQQAGSLAEDLAEAMGVDWKWKGFS